METAAMIEPNTNAQIDQDALAEAYELGLACEKAGDVEGAVAAYERVMALDPFDRGGACVRLAALGRGPTPEKAPDAYVATLFDQHAEVFDQILVEQLGYDAPLQLADLLRSLAEAGAAPARFARMLDLGCGTGLCAEALEDRTDTRIGVDLAEEMVAIASEKELYADLYVAEAVAFLESDAESGAPFDLITATDMLPYLGALEPFFEGVAARLASGGLLAFSSETLPLEAFAGADYRVGPKQRFAHQPDYLIRALAAAGFAPLDASNIVVRYDEGDPILGQMVIAERAEA